MTETTRKIQTRKEKEEGPVVGMAEWSKVADYKSVEVFLRRYTHLQVRQPLLLTYDTISLHDTAKKRKKELRSGYRYGSSDESDGSSDDTSLSWKPFPCSQQRWAAKLVWKNCCAAGNPSLYKFPDELKKEIVGNEDSQFSVRARIPEHSVRVPSSDSRLARPPLLAISLPVATIAPFHIIISSPNARLSI
ncbi:hypothetical protein AgCh_025005 [Apium graveolens]